MNSHVGLGKVLATVAAAAAGICLQTAPANAAVPDHFSFTDSDEEPGFAQCDGFAIDLSTSERVSGSLFYDASGDLDRVQVRTQATDVLTNSVTGKTVINRGVFQETFTRMAGTDDFSHTLVGFRFMGTYPGEGLILQDVGRIVYSPNEEQVLFIAGQHHVPDDGAEALFCAALS